MNEKLKKVIDKIAFQTAHNTLLWNENKELEQQAFSAMASSNYAVQSGFHYTENDTQIIALFETFNELFYLLLIDKKTKQPAFFKIDGSSYYRLQFGILDKEQHGDNLLDDFLKN